LKRHKQLDKHLKKLPEGVPHPFEFQQIRSGPDLKEWRESIGLHPRFVCKILRIPFNTWRTWESGHRRLPDWVFSALWYVAVTQNYFFVTPAERIDLDQFDYEDEEPEFYSPVLGVSHPLEAV
jgi:hypothetical protein